METIIFTKLIKHIWVILLGMFLGATAAFLYTQVRPAEYQVQARLLVGPGIDSARPDLDVLRASGQLILTYAELPTTEPFLRDLIQELNLERETEELANMITVRPNPETQILTIDVRSRDPQEAQNIAYLTADKLVRLSPSNPDSQAVQVKDQIKSQVTELEQSVAATKDLIAQMQLDYQESLDNQQPQQENSGASEAILAQLDTFEQSAAGLSDAASQSTTGVDILKELDANTNARLVQFEYELSRTENPITQKILGEQVRVERGHLSNLRQTIAEINTPIEGMSLDQYILTTQEQIAALEAELPKIFTYDLRRLQFDQINQLENRLSAARAIETERQGKILAQIAKERERVTDVQLAVIENQRQIQERIAQEQIRLSEMQNTLAILYNSSETPDPNQVEIIELANPVPVAPPLSLMVLIGLFAGAFLGTAVVLGIGAMHDTVETSEQVTRHLPVPVVDITTGHSPLASLFDRQLVQKKALERYQMLGMHLLYGQDAAADHQVILVGAVDSNADPGIVAANLAEYLAQSGKQVVLVDANIDNPTITRSYELEKQEGLSELLSGANKRPVPIAPVDASSSIMLLPFGNAPAKTLFLSVPNLKFQLDRLKERAELVLVAVPPLLRPDALALSSYASGVIVVVAKDKTSQQALEELAENFNLVGAKVLSVALADHPFTGEKFAAPHSRGGTPTQDKPISRPTPRPATPADRREGDSYDSRAA